MKFNGSVEIEGFVKNTSMLYSPLAHVTQEEAVGNAASVDSSNRVFLNTVRLNEITGFALNTSTGIMTFPAGKYYIRGFSVSYRSDYHRAELKIDGTSTILLRGNTGYSDFGATPALNIGSYSWIAGVVTFTATSSVVLENPVSDTGNSTAKNGARINSSGVHDKEVYANLLIWKIA